VVLHFVLTSSRSIHQIPSYQCPGKSFCWLTHGTEQGQLEPGCRAKKRKYNTGKCHAAGGQLTLPVVQG
jgi:hypothetical protein